MKLAFRERLREEGSVRIDAPLAALTIPLQPHRSGLTPATWDGTPAHLSGFGPGPGHPGGGS
jgi:hypothetical protein